jgi:sugar lactone lactonase YvrE
VTTWVGRYAIVDGDVREHGPWLVDRQRRHDESTVRLLVLAEPIDERSAEFCNEVAEAVAALFARDSLSITGALLRALQQTHENLAEWNRRSLREHRVAVGVTCVVVRDGQVTIAQVGPGVVYMRDAEAVMRLTTAELPAATPLGTEHTIEPRFTATSIKDREFLLLTSTAETAIPDGAIEAALAAGPERALAALFLATRGVRDMSAVLVADIDLPEAQLTQPLESAPVIWDEEVEGREVASLLDEGPIDSGLDEPPSAAPQPLRELEPTRETEPPRRLPRRVGRTSGPPLPRLRRAPRAMRAGTGIGLPSRSILWTGAVIVALLTLLLAAWLVLPGLLSEDRAAQLEASLADAQTQLQAAESSPNPSEQRAALEAVLVELERARSLAADDPRIANLESLAEARLALLDAVVPVEELITLILFDGSVTAPVTAERIVTGGGAVWLLESDRGRVIRVDATSGEPVEVYRAGETYEGETAGAPQAIGWDASTGQLLTLDEAGVLFATAEAPIGLVTQVLPLRDADDLTAVVDMTVYSGNLYLLDAGGSEVWRYLPAVDGFDSERTGVLGNVELTEPLALAVDGNVFVQDGSTLRRFSDGQELTPMLEGIDAPPDTPVAMVEDALRGLLYVADRGGDRIVVSNRDGTFVRQYRHPDFADLRGLAIAPDGARIYVLTGDRIASFAANGGTGDGSGEDGTGEDEGDTGDGAANGA